MSNCWHCQKHRRIMQQVASLLRQARQTTKPERAKEAIDNALRVMREDD